MLTLLIASTNPGKIREIQSILEDVPIQLITPIDIGVDLRVVEDGKTYEANAQKKAIAYCQAGNLPVLADDSGLEVDVLGGEPGIFSARYSPAAGATDADRRQYLLKKLAGFPQPWRAHFHCSVVIAMPDGEIYHFEGKCYGEIIGEERGTNGFGYDPIFHFPELGKTMAELGEAEKNHISHRGKAVREAIHLIRKIRA